MVGGRGLEPLRDCSHQLPRLPCCKLCCSKAVVSRGRFELPRVSPLTPKASASASFATSTSCVVLFWTIFPSKYDGQVRLMRLPVSPSAHHRCGVCPVFHHLGKDIGGPACQFSRHRQLLPMNSSFNLPGYTYIFRMKGSFLQVKNTNSLSAAHAFFTVPV